MAAESGILSVSGVVRLLQEVVEENFLQVTVTGELSNLARPASGHLYFTLKDDRAQLRAVMFRAQGRLLSFPLADGLQVVARGRLTVYPQRGDLQMVVERLEPTGAGGLQAAFEALRARLETEGLFAAERKRTLPGYPRTVGVVTSASGAAIHDILQVLRRRASGVRVLLCPVRVQGEGAADEIAAAIADLNRHGEADVLIVGRGGGSLEDLWAFNEERVARAIFASRIPVISAVGHEVDVTISDLAADLRAPTPSAAAELVARSRQELETHLDHLAARLATAVTARLVRQREQVRALAERLRLPRELLLRRQLQLDGLRRQLAAAAAARLEREQGRLGRSAAALEALSPLQTLARGYAIAVSEASGQAVRDSASLAVGERLRLTFQRGRAAARVEELEP